MHTGILVVMKLTSVYLAIISIVFFGGYTVNYNSPLEEQKTVAPSPEIKTFVNIESMPEPKIYKKNEQLEPEELKELLYSVGFRGESLKQAWAIAMKESTGRPKAHNKNPATGDNSYGLFQINMIGSLGPARLEKFNLESNKDLFDPVRNAEIAYFMSNGGKNWSAWHGITNKTIDWMNEFPK